MDFEDVLDGLNNDTSVVMSELVTVDLSTKLLVYMEPGIELDDTMDTLVSESGWISPVASVH